jgi:hypothetical protein
VEPFDPTKPNIARVWDYGLGGEDNFAADRDLAEKMLAVHPPTARMARENRQFLGRAVSYVTTHGIRQFIDVGAGLPTALHTHDIAQRVDPQALVAYVDNDPMVISHARSLLAKSPGVIAVPGDMRDPARILADPGLTGLIDLAGPPEGANFTSEYTAARVYIHALEEIQSYSGGRRTGCVTRCC